VCRGEQVLSDFPRFRKRGGFQGDSRVFTEEFWGKKFGSKRGVLIKGRKKGASLFSHPPFWGKQRRVSQHRGVFNTFARSNLWLLNFFLRQPFFCKRGGKKGSPKMCAFSTLFVDRKESFVNLKHRLYRALFWATRFLKTPARIFQPRVAIIWRPTSQPPRRRCFSSARHISNHRTTTYTQILVLQSKQ